MDMVYPESLGYLNVQGIEHSRQSLHELSRLLASLEREKGKARMWVFMSMRSVLYDLRGNLRGWQEMIVTPLHPDGLDRRSRDFEALFAKLESCEKALGSIPLPWVVARMEPLIRAYGQESRQDSKASDQDLDSFKHGVSIGILCMTQWLGFSPSEFNADDTDTLREEEYGEQNLSLHESTSEWPLNNSLSERAIEQLGSVCRCQYSPNFLKIGTSERGSRGMVLSSKA